MFLPRVSFNGCGPDSLSVCLSVTLLCNFHRKQDLRSRGFQNDSPNVLVIGDVKMLRKFEGYHPNEQFFAGTLILVYGKLYSVAATTPLQQQTIIRMTSYKVICNVLKASFTITLSDP